MQELVVISGKGGTGKTSITASLAVLAKSAVVADCDVDAADLHLVLSPQIKERHEFYAGREAVVRPADCIACGACLAHCRFDAIKMTKQSSGELNFFIDPTACEGCGVCVRFCPVQAIGFPERLCGEWFVSETRIGPLVHAKLGIAAENSGKLVSTVRQSARQIAEAEKRSLVIVDGPPGIGCPVIASITGATQVLVVTEPTVSGEHDLERVLALTRHFNIPTAVCVNKWDLNPGMTDHIEKKARKSKARIVGRIRYDLSVTKAQIQALSVIETDSPCAVDIKNIWNKLGLTGD
ncbi:MAG: ATP-binding protein [Candidatus Marinimicrobia bacterium]|nr:ATP-binding protein [Candidatus Neomarinimicrobiota bacterium]